MTAIQDATIWREIDGELLAAAIYMCFGIRSGVRSEAQDVSEDLVRAFVEHLEEGDLVCDHSVNVCACGAREVHESLSLWLARKRICIACGGDATAFLGFDGDGNEMFETCPHCERGYQAAP
jgi:hypothetical protein